jgi:surfeit locus 1 family protein
MPDVKAPDAKAPKGFPWVATVATVICLAILVSLGVWQMQRRVWKAHLLAQVAALQHAPAQPLATVLDKARKGDDVQFTRVRVTCRGIDHATAQELYALVDGKPGVRLVSACATPGGGWSGVLVDRGFIDQTIKTRPPEDGASTADVVVTGVLRKGDKAGPFQPKHSSTQPLWFARDISGMAAALGFSNPAPMMLAAETSTNPTFAELKPAALPSDIPNRHLEYALTWFGLAGVLVAFYAAMVAKRLRARTVP